MLLLGEFGWKWKVKMWIMIAGPYRSGAKTTEEQKQNLSKLNYAAYEVLKKGHTPIIGVNLALPIIEAAGENNFDKIMMPVSLSLCDRCDAILRLGGSSSGADQEVEKFKTAGKPTFSSIDEIPTEA